MQKVNTIKKLTFFCNSFKIKIGESMRIIAGKYRGLKLNEFELNNIRPTIDRVRESIFNKIQFRVAGAIVLDLFGGTGAVSLEFLSRNAERVITADNNAGSIKLIKQNFAKAKINPELLEMDYMKALKKVKEMGIKFDIVFLDPPYDTDYAEKAIVYINENDLLNDDGIIVYEHIEDKNYSLPDNLGLLDKRKYGTVMVSYLEKNNG